MLARLQRFWVLIVVTAAAGLAYRLARSGSPLWVSALAAIAVLNIHAFLLAIEFIWLRNVDPEVDVPKPTNSALIMAWWGEVLIGLQVFAWRQPFRAEAVDDHLTAAQGRRAVLLVHGFVCNRALWNPWMARFRASDTPYVAVNLEPVFSSINDYVPIIESAVARIEAATGTAPLIVAHSMGGLAVRAWRCAHGAPGRVHSIITIGTPHAGTRLARLGISDNTRQMAEGSSWLRALQHAEADAPSTPFTCYFSHCDNIVFPARNATLAAATNQHVPGVAHVDLAFHPPIFDEVMRRVGV